MIVISYGMVRSASSFSFQLIQEIIKKGCNDTADSLLPLGQVIDRIKGNFVGSNEDLISIINELQGHSVNFNKNWVVIKTHSPCTPEISDLLNRGKLLAVANYRHPAEIGLSLRDITRSENENGIHRFNKKYLKLDACIHGVQFHAKTFLGWNKEPRVHKLYYDNIVSNPHATCSYLAEYLRIDVAPQDILKNFQSGNKKIRELNKGVLDRKSKELTVEELAKFENACPELMKILLATELYK